MNAAISVSITNDMRFEELEEYDYDLPEGLIRKRGVEPRDAARLFVYDTAADVVTHAVFSDLAAYLPERALLVLNETRVVPARLMLKKETGGKIEVFVLANERRPEEETVPVLVDRKCVPGMKLLFPDGSFFRVVGQDENRFRVLLHSDEPLETLLDRYGATPIPHYLENGNEAQDETELRKRYQTVFARSGASVAAPTASLHFTDRVFVSLAERGIETVTVELDVGLGTFAPLRPEHFGTRTLHLERITVSQETADRLNRAKSEGNPVVAVGTTALRTLESVVSFPAFRSNGVVIEESTSPLKGESREGVRHPLPGIRGPRVPITEHPAYARPRLLSEGGAGKAGEKCESLFQSFSGETDLFVFPPHRFRSADILLTNFHLPKSSLMLLVEAFLRDKGSKRNLVSLYEEAIQEGYAFYSFGDSMLIL